MGCTPLGSSVHGLLQARILEWVAMPSSRGSSWSGSLTHVSCIAGIFFTCWATREAHSTLYRGEYQKKIKQGRSFIELTFSPPVSDYFSRYTRFLACTYLLFQHWLFMHHFRGLSWGVSVCTVFAIRLTWGCVSLALLQPQTYQVISAHCWGHYHCCQGVKIVSS